MRNAVSCLALVLLAACAPQATDKSVDAVRNEQIKTSSFNIGGSPSRCLPWDSLHLTQNIHNELVGELRNRFLTAEAEASGVRVFTTGGDVSSYGSTVVYYTNQNGTCLLFAETLSLQEYTIKAGLVPTSVTPGYVFSPEKQPTTLGDNK